MALNSIIIEGKFGHFTSKKGAEKTTFTIIYKDQSFNVITEGILAQSATLYRKNNVLRIVGSLRKVGRSTLISAQHIENYYKK